LEAGILAGITRALVVGRVAQAAGLAVCETVLRPADAPRMSEAFLMSTTRDITPVAELGGRRFAIGPATATARLKAAFLQHAASEAARHPERRL
jgi:branched-chain amino acid aminotransferase